MSIDECGLTDFSFLKVYNPRLFVSLNQDDLDFAKIDAEFFNLFKGLHLFKRATKESVSQNFYLKSARHGKRENSMVTVDVLDTTLIDIERFCSYIDNLCASTIRLKAGNIGLIQDFFDRVDEKIDSGFVITISDLSVLDKEKVEKLNAGEKIFAIRVLDENCDDNLTPYRFEYFPEIYIELKKKIIEEVTKGISADMPELQKFMMIYRRLGSIIKYDYGIIGKNQYSDYAKRNVDNCRNCINGLLKHTCVCAGYADILYNCLREVGIEAYKVTGIAGEYHQWNKVKIDDVFYNTDLTWDADDIAKGVIVDLKYCLVGDKEFSKLHKELDGKKDKCPRSFSRDKVRKAFREALIADEIEPKNYITEELKSELKDIKRGFIELRKQILKRSWNNKKNC